MLIEIRLTLPTVGRKILIIHHVEMMWQSRCHPRRGAVRSAGPSAFCRDAWQGLVTAWKPHTPPRVVPLLRETYIALASPAGGSRTPPSPPRPRTSTAPAARHTALASNPPRPDTEGGRRWPCRRRSHSARFAASAAGRRTGLRMQRAASEQCCGSSVAVSAQDSPPP